MKPKVSQNDVERFSTIIMDIVRTDRISYIEAIVEYCEEIGLEVDLAVQLLSPSIVSKITEEATNNNLIEKNIMLPL